MSNFKSFKIDTFKKYIDTLKVSRTIRRIQLHHTWSPAYAQFKGNNHEALQKGMQSYHVKTNGWNDIGQHFTIFPDGVIMTGRNIESIPAGIKGANGSAISIECIGNFDRGGDVMTDAQKQAIVAVVKILLDKFGLSAKTGVTYHAWWTASGTHLGTYIAGRSSKTCPGTNFFGGNTREAYEKNLLPLIEGYGKKMLETPNDITWELNHRHFPIKDTADFVKALEIAKNDPVLDNLYWGFYKLVNGIKN